jgi:2-hydroxy-3-oxopropionate reductase
MKVGFIGLGAMGRPMALHLQAAGHELHVWARRPASADGLPATVHPTPAALGAACEVVFTVITSSADVEGVALGDKGLIHGMAPGSVLVDCSTIAPDVARRIAGQLAEKGIHMLDAPVSGGEQGARDATLAIMAGGDAAVLERVRPLLEKLGQRIVHIGPNGAGQVAKACNQMIMVAAIEAVAEALRLAAAAGVDPAKVKQALAGGSAGSRVLEIMGSAWSTAILRPASRPACTTRTSGGARSGPPERRAGGADGKRRAAVECTDGAGFRQGRYEFVAAGAGD